MIRHAERVIGAVLSAVFSRFRVRLFRVEGSSMEPTLTEGEYVIVNNFRYPWFGALRRGDVVVFECPHAHHHVLIKRVIGLGGEKVEVQKGQVYIDNQPLEEPYTAAAGTYSWGPFIVPRGEFFVLGDNRNNLCDSHTWGWLPSRNIIGRFWSLY
jgi:signal peptidase I